MEPIAVTLLVLITAATAGLILAERTGSRVGMWVAKPLASAAFVALGWPGVDLWIFIALVLSFFGDLCLIPTDKRIFRAGIVLFLLAHVAFSVAFVFRGVAWERAGLALVPLVSAAFFIGGWILPHVPRELKGAVLAYIVVITGMVALAVGTTWWLALAAVAFWSNDILVARDRFVERSWLNGAYGLPLYYGAMAVFALVARGTL